MNGWLIYNSEGVKRNEWFIRRMQEEAEKLGMRLQVKVANSIKDIENEALPAFAIVRAFNFNINEYLEVLGVRTFNNAKTAKTAGDKWETYRLCKQLHIPVLQTELADDAYENGIYPCVVKSRYGHGGSQVFWAENTAQAKQWSDGKNTYIMQQPSATLGQDVRVYAVGDRVVAAVKRYSEKDFRSNFSLGGSVELIQPSEEQRKIVQMLRAYLRFDFIGVDFLPNGDSFVLNELEDAAGARMLYACSTVDIVKVFIRYVYDSLK